MGSSAGDGVAPVCVCELKSCQLKVTKCNHHGAKKAHDAKGIVPCPSDLWLPQLFDKLLQATDEKVSRKYLTVVTV